MRGSSVIQSTALCSGFVSVSCSSKTSHGACHVLTPFSHPSNTPLHIPPLADMFPRASGTKAGSPLTATLWLAGNDCCGTQRCRRLLRVKYCPPQGVRMAGRPLARGSVIDVRFYGDHVAPWHVKYTPQKRKYTQTDRQTDRQTLTHSLTHHSRQTVPDRWSVGGAVSGASLRRHNTCERDSTEQPPQPSTNRLRTLAGTSSRRRWSAPAVCHGATSTGTCSTSRLDPSDHAHTRTKSTPSRSLE